MKRTILGFLLVVACFVNVLAQDAQPTRADSLRGSITPERAWWDVVHYDLTLRPDHTDSTLFGANTITYRVVHSANVMQIDLLEPLNIQKITQDGRELSFTRDGNAFFVDMGTSQNPGEIKSVTVEYGGRPTVARRPPWDGGLVWTADSLGRPWIATACQGIGASAWWPVKDHQTEEPDSMTVTVVVPQGLMGVSNGRLRDRRMNADGTESFEWFVANPINNYGITMNVAHYTMFEEQYEGEEGTLDIAHWVLDYNLDRAKAHFSVVHPMIEAFEYWFGPYPFYEDSFKLIETPFLGMEHQSGVAYGNFFKLGYNGRDLSGSGWGLKWDFMIIHESGHEWFGNNITTEDIADMWVHEGFTNYSESLFTEYVYGTEGGQAYAQGIRRNIRNDIPVIGEYGLHRRGSGSDMYYKGSAMIHTVRQVIDNDELFREILRGLNSDFRHGIVTSAIVEDYISEKSGIDFGRVFDQYLRTVDIPHLNYSIENGVVRYRWENVVDGFAMPVRVFLQDDETLWLTPDSSWKEVTIGEGTTITIDPNFYVIDKTTIE